MGPQVKPEAQAYANFYTLSPCNIAASGRPAQRKPLRCGYRSIEADRTRRARCYATDRIAVHRRQIDEHVREGRDGYPNAVGAAARPSAKRGCARFWHENSLAKSR